MPVNNYFFLILFWGIYFLFHSLLASDKVKERLSFVGKYYRVCYNLIATGGLLFILFYAALIPPIKFYETTNLTKFLSLIPATYGILVIKSAFRIYSLREFIGINQLKDSDSMEEFKKEGILKKVRHPLYSGSILILLGFIIFSPSLGNFINFTCILIYIFIGIKLEEKKLVKIYGQKYAEYKTKVPMLIPKLNFKNR